MTEKTIDSALAFAKKMQELMQSPLLEWMQKYHLEAFRYIRDEAWKLTTFRVDAEDLYGMFHWRTAQIGGIDQDTAQEYWAYVHRRWILDHTCMKKTPKHIQELLEASQTPLDSAPDSKTEGAASVRETQEYLCRKRGEAPVPEATVALRREVRKWL